MIWVFGYRRRRSLGLNISSSEYPMRTKERERMAIASPGGRIHHQEPTAWAASALARMCPQEGTVGSPRPRKDNAASDKIAAGTVRARLTYVKETMLVKICFTKILEVHEPESVDASTKDRHFSLNTL